MLFLFVQIFEIYYILKSFVNYIYIYIVFHFIEPGDNIFFSHVNNFLRNTPAYM